MHEFTVVQSEQHALPLKVGERVRFGFRKNEWLNAAVFAIHENDRYEIQVPIESDPSRTMVYHNIDRKRIKRHDTHLSSSPEWVNAIVADTEYPGLPISAAVPNSAWLLTCHN